MNPVAFKLFGIEIMWYGVCISLGVLATIVFTYLFLRKYKIYNENDFFGLIMTTVISGFIGARVWYVLFNLDYYTSFWQMLNFRQGGIAFHGGVIFGVIGIISYCKWKKMDTLRYLDFLGVGTLLAQAMGRWGNFFNQEAYGSTVSAEYISRFPKFIQEGMLIDGSYHHPTFLYESMSNVLWVAVLGFLMWRFPKIRKGTFFALALIGNSITRIFVEALRTDSLMLGDVKVAQLIGVLAIFLSLSYLLYIYTDDLRTGKTGKTGKNGKNGKNGKKRKKK